MAKKEDAAVEAVLQYLIDQNRPYSTQDVFMNLHKQHGKPLVQRVIDQLVAEGKLKEKINGKQKCYVANQDNLPTASEEELVKLDAECDRLSDEFTRKQENLKILESKVRKLNSSLTTKDAREKLDSLTAENEQLQARLSLLENQQVLVTEEEKLRINKEWSAALGNWKKRKRMCMNALDSVLESWPKSKKDLFEKIGIETDEDVGASLPKVG